MTGRCTVCQSPARYAIDRGLIERESYRKLAPLAGVSRMSVWRHGHTGLPAMLAGELMASAAPLGIFLSIPETSPSAGNDARSGAPVAGRD